MSILTKTSLRESKNDLYEMKGFNPRIINQDYLNELKVSVRPSNETLEELKQGSMSFAEKYKKKAFIAKLSWQEKDIPMDKPLKHHRYTCKCPTDILEVDPVVGCNVNCLYCLVTDGDHSAQKTVYKNYASYLNRRLQENRDSYYCYYLAPQTEPFQESTLQTGIAHDILRTFISHFKENPKSKSFVFVLSKAGQEELQYESKGKTIIDLMSELRDKLVYHTSISVIPPKLCPMLEPRAATNEDRLEAVMMCQKHGIKANWAVMQPIMPLFITDRMMDEVFKELKEANIEGCKPEFLTLSVRNIAWIGQLIGQLDKNMERQFYELYISPENMNNVKHRNRIAPDRKATHKAMMILKEYADKYGLEMSICHWVRNELNITQTELPLTMRENLLGDRPVSIGVCKPASFSAR
jgi:DNA repair photolyase